MFAKTPVTDEATGTVTEKVKVYYSIGFIQLTFTFLAANQKSRGWGFAT